MVDDRHMLHAIELAREWPHTHPNPRVGAVVVSDTGEIVGEGWHRGPGTDHAEVVAIAEAGESTRGSTLYVTLEPCSHHGRTPPCVDAVISAGVSTVVIAAIDPDTHVAGTGVERLRAAGIEVIDGILEEQGRSVDPAYFRHRETGLALVTVKWAMTLDGSVAATDGTSRWITGDQARAEVHELRAQVDGVVIGAGTLRTDDPTLDVRLDGFEGPQPRPVLIAGGGALPEDARVWERDPVVVTAHPREVPAGQILEVPGPDGRPDPAAACRALADAGLLDLLLEGGPSLAGSWWRAGVVTRGFVHVGARVGGGSGLGPLAGPFDTIADARSVEFGEPRGVGEDVVIPFERRD